MLAADTEDFARVRLRPLDPARVSRPDTANKILGRIRHAPVGVMPPGLSGPRAVVGGARCHVGTVARFPVVLSTFAGRTVEELAVDSEIRPRISLGASAGYRG